MFQVFEKQDEPLNERSYYVGTVFGGIAIGFADCGLWLVQATSARSVKLQLSEHLLYTLTSPLAGFVPSMRRSGSALCQWARDGKLTYSVAK